MTTDDKRAKMLERVRALLAKAEDKAVTPAEADSFRAKADELMESYAIEQWQVDEAQAGIHRRVQPEARQYDMTWYLDNARRNELWWLMQVVSHHCRIRLVPHRFTTSGVIPMIGIPSDLDYFDMLFTHLMLQMAKGLEPHPDPNKEMIENLVVMKEAGMKWERIGELLIKAGQLDSYDRNMGVKFTKLYTEYCRDNGRERLRTTPAMYQRSYAKGFVAELSTRLRRQEKERGTGVELVVKDMAEEFRKMADDMFGTPPPASRALSREERVDAAAYDSGARDGSKARLHANPNETVRRGSARELES